jgi:hypothetical protein
MRSLDDRALVVQVVNPSGTAVPTSLELGGFVTVKPWAQVTELAAPLEAVNTAESPLSVAPQHLTWRHNLAEGPARRSLPPYSFTVLRFE